MNQENEFVHISSHHVIDVWYEQAADVLHHYCNPDGSPVLYVKVYVENDDGISRDDCRRRAFIKQALAKPKTQENIQEYIGFPGGSIVPGHKEVQKGAKIPVSRATRDLGLVEFTGAQKLLDVKNFKKGDVIKSYWVDQCDAPPVTELNGRPILCWSDATVLPAAFGMPHAWQWQNRDSRFKGFVALGQMFVADLIVSERLQRLLPILENEVKYGNAYQTAYQDYIKLGYPAEKQTKENMPKIREAWERLERAVDEYETHCAPLTFKAQLKNYKYHKEYE